MFSEKYGLDKADQMRIAQRWAETNAHTDLASLGTLGRMLFLGKIATSGLLPKADAEYWMPPDDDVSTKMPTTLPERSEQQETA